MVAVNREGSVFLGWTRGIGPLVVLSATVFLTAISAAVTGIAFTIYTTQTASAIVGTSQSLMLLAVRHQFGDSSGNADIPKCIASFVFLGLYLAAARRNEPVGESRPPALPLHGACFITMRIIAILWLAAVVITLATTWKMIECNTLTKLCLLQRINTIMATLAM
jgi:hypothetical protein